MNIERPVGRGIKAPLEDVVFSIKIAVCVME